MVERELETSQPLKSVWCWVWGIGPVALGTLTLQQAFASVGLGVRVLLRFLSHGPWALSYKGHARGGVGRRAEGIRGILAAVYLCTDGCLAESTDLHGTAVNPVGTVQRPYRIMSCPLPPGAMHLRAYHSIHVFVTAQGPSGRHRGTREHCKGRALPLDLGRWGASGRGTGSDPKVAAGEDLQQATGMDGGEGERLRLRR